MLALQLLLQLERKAQRNSPQGSLQVPLLIPEYLGQYAANTLMLSNSRELNDRGTLSHKLFRALHSPFFVPLPRHTRSAPVSSFSMSSVAVSLSSIQWFVRHEDRVTQGPITRYPQILCRLWFCDPP